ncbi:MAG: hypothetical protein ACI8P9_000726 [Parasphingorhabdus sp.]|jgi:hypothetical protein
MTTDSNARGMLGVLLGVLFFSVHDNVIRFLSGEFSVMEIFFSERYLPSPQWL